MKTILLFSSFLVGSGSLNAAITFTMQESGGNVVMTSTGSLPVPDPSIVGGPLFNSEAGKVRSGLAEFAVGETVRDPIIDFVTLTFEDAIVSGPSSIGVALGLSPATTSSGNFFSLIGLEDNTAIVLDGIVYNNTFPLPYSAGTSTWNGTTLAGLSVNPGTYVWTTDARFGGETITLNVVPEPSSSLLLGLSLFGLAGFRKRK